MTAASPAPRPARPWRPLLVLALLAAAVGLCGAAAGWWLRREAPPAPPEVDVTGADEEVARLLESLRQEVKADPRSARRWGLLGMALRAHDFGSEANVCFAQAERLDPREPRWPYYRGLTLVLTDPEEGAACLRRAVAQLDDQTQAPRFRLAEVLIEQGKLDEAGRLLAQALAHEPGHLRGRLLQARLALAAGDAKGCLDALEGCWGEPHVRHQAHLLGAEAWQRRGDAARGDELLAKVRQMPPDVPWRDPLVEEVERLVVGVRARLALAAGLSREGRTDEAIDLLEQVVEDRPGEATAWLLLGQLHAQRGRAARAEQALARAVAQNPASVDGWFGLGMVRQGDRPREAAAAFREAARLKPDHTLAHYHLGVCLKRLGDRDGAARHFREALRCQPDHEGARRALADLEGRTVREP
jgi:cytochrome c-type biogenesis protein CcmH/NrfG